MPDIVIKRRIPDQDFSEMAWIGWRNEAMLLNVLVYPESGSSLDGANNQFDDDIFDIWINYYQVSVASNGSIWRVIPGGGGGGDLSGIALTQRYRHQAIKCTLTKNIANRNSGLLQLPVERKGNLYSIEIGESLAQMLPIKEGNQMALALVVNNVDRTGRGVKNRGYSPSGWRWADTDTYHKAVLVK